RSAIVHLHVVDFGADRGRRRMSATAQEPEKGAIAAAVVENSFALERAHQPQAGGKAAPVAPSDQPILAEDLFGGVMPIAKRPVDALVGQNFFSRFSHVPRIVIQNDSRIRRTSSTNERRRRYSRSKRNFCRREMSRG